MKLIKINTDHYVVVDDSEIKEGDFVYDTITNTIWTWEKYNEDEIDSKYRGKVFKITHSTNIITNGMGILYLSEVKELIGEVDVEKKIYALCQSECIVDSYGKATDDGMVIGIRAYNQALEDNKEKKYTEEDMIGFFDWSLGINVVEMLCNNMPKKEIFQKYIQSIQPKTDWEVQIVDGKLKLK